MSRPIPTSSPEPRPPRAFTLVELLAVIAIVSVLVGLLLPALRGGRDASRQAVCASNVRQLATANALYADDHRDRYAPGAPGFLQNLTRWHGARQFPSQPFRSAGGSLSDYIDPSAPSDDPAAPSAMRACPSFAGTLAALDEHHAGFERSCGGYGYNTVFVGSSRRRLPSSSPAAWVLATDRVGSPRSAFASPSATVEFADAAFATSEGPAGVIEYSFLEPRFWPDFPGSRADPSIHFRHGGPPAAAPSHAVAAAAFLDGHASARAFSDTWSSGIYGIDPASVRVGWFRPGEANEAFDYD